MLPVATLPISAPSVGLSAYAESNRIRSGQVADENIVTALDDKEARPVVPGDILDEAAVLALQRDESLPGRRRHCCAMRLLPPRHILMPVSLSRRVRSEERVSPIGHADAIPAVGDDSIANVGVASFDPDT